MTPEDVHHPLAVGRPAGGGTDEFSRFAEICGTHYRRGYDGELFRVLAAEVIKAVHHAPGDAQHLTGPTSIGVPSTVQVRTPSIP